MSASAAERHRVAVFLCNGASVERDPNGWKKSRPHILLGAECRNADEQSLPGAYRADKQYAVLSKARIKRCNNGRATMQDMYP